MSIINSNRWSEVKSEINNNALSRTGGEITGDINMSDNNITGLGDAVNDSDAVSKGYLKALRPFAMQLISVTLDYNHSPTGKTEEVISLNPEFEQNFSKFIFICPGAQKNVKNSFIMSNGGNCRYTLISESTFNYIEMEITHLKEESSFKFTVSHTYSSVNNVSRQFLVIGIK